MGMINTFIGEFQIDEEIGKRWWWHTVKGVRYKVFLEDEGVKCNDVWIIPYIVSTAKERVDYGTQKPKKLFFITSFLRP